MSSKKEIDDAFEAFYADDTIWYEIGNLCFEDLTKVDKQYLFDKVDELCNERLMPRELLDFLRWAITQELDVPEDAIDKFGLLFLRSDSATDSWFAFEIAKLYRKEAYFGNGGNRFDSPENLRKWISISFDLASSPADYIHIIENVAQVSSGLHLGDKSWGQELLKQVKSKTDDKTFKKVEKAVKSILA